MRKISVFGLCLVLAFGVTACGGKNDKKQVGEGTIAKETVVEETTTSRNQVNKLVKTGDVKFMDEYCTEDAEYSIDLNYDGTDEVVKINYSEDDEYIADFKLTVNDKEVVAKNGYFNVSAFFVDIDRTDDSAELVLAFGGDGSKRHVSVYKYENDEMICVSENMDENPALAAFSYGDGEFSLEVDDAADKVGCLRFRRTYAYENGKLVDTAKDNVYQVSDYSYVDGVELSTQYKYTVAKEITLYKDANCAKADGALKKGDIMTLSRVMLADKKKLEYEGETPFYICAVEVKVNGEVVGWIDTSDYNGMNFDLFIDVPMYE